MISFGNVTIPDPVAPPPCLNRISEVVLPEGFAQMPSPEMVNVPPGNVSSVPLFGLRNREPAKVS